MSIGRVFFIPIEGLSLEATLRRVETTAEPVWIVTANPEILLEAHRNSAYADTIRRATLRLVDGFGLWLVLRLFGNKTKRVTGVELAESLVQLAVQRHWNVALIGGGQGIAEHAAQKTEEAYSGIRIAAENGGNVSPDGTDDSDGTEARSRLARFAPQILLVAFGHPKQEMWIAKHVNEFPSVKAVVGVGGTLDYWAGTKKRAPTNVRALGLEWLYRLSKEPIRWKRILNALVVFPVTAIVDGRSKKTR